MAKSRLEPRKIERYAESSIPKNGISGRPSPRIQRSAVQSAPKEASIPADAAQVSATTPVAATPPTPPPPPPPVVVSRDRAGLYFDGSTDVTGSFYNGYAFSAGSFDIQISPGFKATETGSYTLFSIATKDAEVGKDNTDTSRFWVYIKKELKPGEVGTPTPSNTQTLLVVDTSISGSRKISKGVLGNTLGSDVVKSQRITGKLIRCGLFRLYMNGYYRNFTTSIVSGSSAVFDQGRPMPGPVHDLCLGSPNSGSNHFFTGSIDTFMFSHRHATKQGKRVPDYSNDSKAGIYFEFEDTLQDKKNRQDLGLSTGTLAYISSSGV